MSTELNVIDSAVLSETERAELDTNIDALIAAHKNSRQEINRLVFESVAAMTVGEDYERQLANKKGLRRFIGGITGSNKRLQDKINSSRAAAQYASQQTLQRLAEQNLMTFDLIAAVNNKLNASVVAVESEINQIYSALITFFKQNDVKMKQLEERVGRLEWDRDLRDWKDDIKYDTFHGVDYVDLDDTAKIVCLVRDFYDITKGNWTAQDLRVLRPAMDKIEVSPKKVVNYLSFIQELHEREELREKLLNGQNIVALPQPDYLPLLCGVKKLEMLETEESYIVETTMGLLSHHQMDVEPKQILNDLAVNYLAQEGSVNINSEVDCYSLVLELLFSLRQAQEEGILSGDAENVIDVEVPVEVPAEEGAPSEKELSSDEWYELGLKYEQGDPDAQDYMGRTRSDYTVQPANNRFTGNSPFASISGVFTPMQVNSWIVKAIDEVICRTPEQRKETFTSYKKLAELGQPAAQYCIGRCYEYGIGIEQDISQAKEWYRKAAGAGNKQAEERLKNLL